MTTASGAVSERRTANRAHWEPDIETGEPSLVAKIVRLNLLVTKALEDVASKAGINLADYLVLGVVRRSTDERTTPSRIAEVLRRTTGGMTLTINRLEQAGWLVRTADLDDRRRVHVTLTPQGRDLAVAVNDDLHRWEDRLALPERARQRIESELDALLALFAD